MRIKSLTRIQKDLEEEVSSLYPVMAPYIHIRLGYYPKGMVHMLGTPFLPFTNKKGTGYFDVFSRACAKWGYEIRSVSVSREVEIRCQCIRQRNRKWGKRRDLSHLPNPLRATMYLRGILSRGQPLQATGLRDRKRKFLAHIIRTKTGWLFYSDSVPDTFLKFALTPRNGVGKALWHIPSGTMLKFPWLAFEGIQDRSTQSYNLLIQNLLEINGESHIRDINTVDLLCWL